MFSHTAVSLENPFVGFMPKVLKPLKTQTLPHLKKPITCFQQQNPNITNKPTAAMFNSNPVYVKKRKKQREHEKERDFAQVGSRKMLLLCGLGYWVQGFRVFPWLGLNFHMANYLNLHPSTLQIVQNCGNLPMVAKPLYGVLSDVIYIGGAHRIPYISIGVLLQVLSWGPLALIPSARDALPNLIAFVLLSNLGASITEVAKDALVAEYGQKHRISGLQSYAYMALAAGGISGNLVGGYFLQKMPPRTMFFIFSSLLALQLAISFSTRENSLGLPQLSDSNFAKKPISEDVGKQFSDLVTVLSNESISQPLKWIVGSIVTVPLLSGSIFCYQTQCLNLDPSIIGMSRVIGHLVLLSGTVLYDRYCKHIPMQKLIGALQILYASSLLLDLVLVKQMNLRFGIPNDVFVLCFSALAEALAQFKLLPFSVLLASLCPRGCEGSLTAFFASVSCLSSIVSGFLGVGLASLLGVTSGDYSGLTMGILIQFLAALVPLRWIHYVPMTEPVAKKKIRKGVSRRTRRNPRVGKVVLGSIYAYEHEKESEMQE